MKLISFNDIEKLITRFQELKINEVVDFERFSHYAITHHSTFIEGSTLTENETRVLLEEDLTPNGKPLAHCLMTKDHYEALLFTLTCAKEKREFSIDLVKEINAKVLENTGALYSTVLGDVDSSKGEYRLGNVRAGNRYFVTYDKVPKLTSLLCEKIATILSDKELDLEFKFNLSIDVHFDLVSIHPFYDGNGMTSRLIMNFIQHYFYIPLALVYKQDKAEYFDALELSREEEKMEPFRQFMYRQYSKYLSGEINKYEDSSIDPTSKFSFIF